MRSGRMPADAVLDGFLVLLAGILFVLPGVLTDVAGIALVFPPSRRLVKRGLVAWIKRRIDRRLGGDGDTFWQESGRPTRIARDQIVDAKVLGTHVEDVNKPSF